MTLRRRSFWQLPALLFLGLIILGGVGFALYTFGTEDRPAPGGAITEGVVGSPSSLNPLLAAFNDVDKDLTSLLFAGLTRLGPDGSIEPDLADSWEISEDGKTYVFHIRTDVKWHDGDSVVPEDVVFTFRLLQSKNLPTNPDITALWQKVRVEQEGAESVRFTLGQPFAPFLSYTTVGILPQHLLPDVRPADMPRAAFNANPVGNGPFIIKRVALDEVRLEANPLYHGGRPLLDSITFKFLKDDKALAAALNTHQVDAGLLRSSAGRDALALAQQNPDMVLRGVPRVSYSLLFLNTQSPLFQDKLVRQAIAYGIDKQALVEDVVDSMGVVANSPIPPDTWAYNPEIKHNSYDPERAAELLDESGWKHNAKGVREKDGVPLKFVLLTNDDKVRVIIAEHLVRSFRELGMDVEAQSSGPTELIQNFLLPRKYQAILYGLDPGYDPDLYPIWHSSQSSGPGLNVAAYANPELDTLLEQARTSTDRERRRDLYWQSQALFAEEVPSILLYYPLYTYVQHRRINGVSLGILFDTSSRFSNVKDWYLQTQRVWKR